MSSQKQKNRRVEGGGGGSTKPPLTTAASSARTQSASVGSVDVSVREQTESQTSVLFTSGATAHYNGVNEEQM